MGVLQRGGFVLAPGISLLLLTGCAGFFSDTHRATLPPSTYTRTTLLGDGGETGLAERQMVRPRRPAAVSFESYTVVRGDSLWSVARKFGVPLGALLETNGLGRDDVLRVGQELRIPCRPQSGPAGEIYVVQRGDTLSSLARRWNCSVADIRRTNGLDGDGLVSGQRLTIPPNAVPGTAAVGGGGPAVGSGGDSYVVRRGDTLSSIAAARGATVRELCSLNGISEPNRIREGQTLRVPARKAAVAGQPREEMAKPSPVAAAKPAAAVAPKPAQQQPLRSDDDLLGLFDEADLFSNFR
ncbi:MAG: LysM peptidoglycan-binding domain-containing protein [Puniceicoccales bacterium]|jgi:LysM repeat protein|nr:LysM peptidoglycan-binding domain-containing protein [Puniceicoccales bacterium]